MMMMTASELIAALHEQIRIRGDLPVMHITRDAAQPIQAVLPRDPAEREPTICVAGDWSTPFRGGML